MSAYNFNCEVQNNELDLFYEGDGIAIDMQPTSNNRMYGQLDPLHRPSCEVIMPVAEVENLITNLQTMVAKIRERHPDAA